MKKNIIIFSTVVAALGLLSFGWINSTDSAPDSEAIQTKQSANFDSGLLHMFNRPANPDFFYAVGSRFMATVTKEKLHKSTSISQIIPADADWTKYPIQFVQVSILGDENEKSELGNDLVLNAAQTKLLKSINYSDNFRFTASCVGTVDGSGNIDPCDLAYYLTLIPEKEAEYSLGEEGLLTFLRQNSEAKTVNLSGDELQPGKVYFTITSNGTVSNVKLESTCGYPLIDETMIELLSKAPGKWISAENSKGENVDQTFVFSYGKVGC